MQHHLNLMFCRVNNYIHTQEERNFSYCRLKWIIIKNFTWAITKINHCNVMPSKLLIIWLDPIQAIIGGWSSELVWNKNCDLDSALQPNEEIHCMVCTPCFTPLHLTTLLRTKCIVEINECHNQWRLWRTKCTGNRKYMLKYIWEIRNKSFQYRSINNWVW